MCGILGIYGTDLSPDVDQRLAAGLEALHHRGPDDRGLESFAVAGGTLVLGHTRLSIIDLSAGGHQPMNSADRRYHIVFNGEIYNYRELRKALQQLGHRFRTECDTEVLLASWAQWGLDCLHRLRGMFAFAIFDRESHTLTCVRDAFGIKPLYYTMDAKGLQFASEIPALLKLTGERPQLDYRRAYDYLVHGQYDDDAGTFLDGVFHLLPGHVMVVDLASMSAARSKSGTCFARPDERRWWWPSIDERTELSFSQAADQLREMFLDNICLHLRSDVPLGAALSGGIDSSAVVCAMRHLNPDMCIHTFSFVAPGSPVDEEPWVDLVNSHAGAIPHKVMISPEEMADDMDDMIRAQGEPFASTSIYAQYRVFKLAREHGITVTLDGQGADELLAGYQGYPHARMRSLVERGDWSGLVDFVRGWSSWPGRNLKQGLRMALRDSLPPRAVTTLRRMRGSRIPAWLNVDEFRAKGIHHDPPTQDSIQANGKSGSHGRRLAEVLRMAQSGKGLHSLLRHGDRNAMRWSIESRVPFLTHELSAFLLSLPEDYLLSHQGETKHVFRAALRGIVPDSVLDRKDKVGFTTPEQGWLRSLSGAVMSWTDISEKLPFFHRDPLRHAVKNALDGEAALDGRIWRILNYCRWVEVMDLAVD
jgi:asparagine synthase (glutamine-hydrolysing)